MNSQSTRKRILSAAIGAALLAGALALWHVLRPDPVTERRVPVSELVQRDQRMFVKDESEPFTGRMFDSYPDGTIKSLSTLVDGVLNGLSEGWHTNGLLQVREHFRDGVSHGVRTKWFADGGTLSEATIENGKIVGTFRRWHPNGTLAEEIEMKDGEPHGLSRSYHPDGSLKAQVRFEYGQMIEQQFWDEGELREPPIARSAD